MILRIIALAMHLCGLYSSLLLRNWEHGMLFFILGQLYLVRSKQDQQ